MSVRIYYAPFLWYLGFKRGFDKCKKKIDCLPTTNLC